MNSFAECVLGSLSTRLLVLDEDLNVTYANPAYCELRGLPVDQVVGKHIAEVFPSSILEDAGLGDFIRRALQGGERIKWWGYRQATADHGERIVNIRVDPCSEPGYPTHVLLTIEDVTDQHRQSYQQNMLQQITQAMSGIVELPRLLHATLTGLTAGGAAGLGFNRAILLLIDEEDKVLRAEMAVGPENAEQAGQIWAQVAEDHGTLQDFLADYDSLLPPAERPLAGLAGQLVFPTEDTDVLPMSAIASRRTIHVTPHNSDQPTYSQLQSLLKSDEFVVAPLVVKDEGMGAVVADNFVTGEPISEADVQLLTALADHAALAIDSAHIYEELRQRVEELDRAYRQLEAAQQEIVRAEKLSTIGEVTAIVAHEIRNPLSTIGGFARSMSRDPDNTNTIKRNALIITEEVERLERILRNLLDFTKPAEPLLVLHNIEPLIRRVGQVIAEQAEACGVKLSIQVQDELPEVYLDESQLHQVMINLAKNGLEAMPEGGQLEMGAREADGSVEMYVTDTGEGISEEHIEQIFDTFFTTKRNGTGLGLALTRNIIQEHGGELYVRSAPGEGSTFVMSLPIPAENRFE